MKDHRWIDDQRLEVDGARFVATSVLVGGARDNYVIVKSPELVRRYLALLAEEQPRSIVELGVREGGSTALMALVAEPDLLLALDLEPEIPPPLAELIATRGLGASVFTAFGLDQGDRAALTSFVDAHRPAAGFDLVIDDASHMLHPTRTSFEVLFPRVRPGGLYVVEDWALECMVASHLNRVLEGAADFDDRLGSVNQVFHSLNVPDAALRDEIRVRMVDAAAGQSGGGAHSGFDSFFESMVEMASRIDPNALDATPIARSRPLADLAVELMMIGATSRHLIDAISIEGGWLSVRRGQAEVPLDSFRLDGCWTDFFGYLR